MATQWLPIIFSSDHFKIIKKEVSVDFT